MARTDKLTRLIAVFDQFHNSIERLDDPTAKRLVGNWAGLRHQYTSRAGVPRSALVAGMGQGFREMPMLLQSMNSEARKFASRALAEATSAHYPELSVKDAERLAKIKLRRSIDSETEFYLVRHHVELLEGEPDHGDERRLLMELV